MRISKIFLIMMIGFGCHATAAPGDAALQAAPFDELQAQIDDMAARIEELENSLPNVSVEGRTYCMMVNSVALRGYTNSGAEQVETIVVRRLASFVNGSFTAPLVSGSLNGQRGNGVVESVPGGTPEVLEGAYVQTGNQLLLQLTDGSVATWYTSGDGSIIQGNGIVLLGPFPNSLTLGIARSATMVEATNCDALGA